MRAARAAFCIAGVALGPSACLSDLSTPKGAEIACSKEDPACPAPLVCATAAGLCVDPDLVNLDAITIEVTSPAAHPRMSRVSPFDENSAEVSLSRKPVALVGDVDGEAADCALRDDGLAATCTWSTPEGEDGPRALVITATDEVGGTVSARVPFDVDTRGPSLLQDLVTIQYEPALDNPRRPDGATSSTTGTTVRVSLTFDEPVALDAEVSLAGAVLAPLGDTAGTSPTLGRLFVDDGAAPDAGYALEIVAKDDVGNESDLVTDAVVVLDHTPPAPPDVVSDAIVLHRAPWGEVVDDGADRSLGDPVVQVNGAPGATADDARRVRAFIQGRVVGDALTDDDGGFAMPLLVGDARAVALRAFDDAGNASDEVAVHNIEWVGAFGGKVPGSIFENPHVASTVQELGVAPDASPAAEVDAPEALVLADGARIEAGVARSWREIKNGAALPSRADFGFVWDTNRDVAVVTGGILGSTALASDTFELDDELWVNRAIPSPPARSAAAVAFDVRRGRTVVFGGLTSGGVVNDTWEYDGASWVKRPVQGPPARSAAAMAYDLDTGLVVLVGGKGAGNADLDDTWTWDGVSWAQIGGDGVNAPPARAAPTMAYDPERRRMVMFGGANGATGRGDVWVLEDGAWRELSTTGGPEGHIPMAYEPATGAMLLVGGSSPGSEGVPNTMRVWRLDDASWTLVDATFPRPDDRFGHGLVTDAARGRVVLLAGLLEDAGAVSGSLPAVNDAWSFDGSAWTPIVRPVAKLIDIAPGGAAFDPLTRRVLAVAGEFVGGGVAISTDTLAFDGTSWASLNPPTVPGFGSSACIGRLFGQLAFFQGNLSTWNGSDWTFVPFDGLDTVFPSCAATQDQGGSFLVNVSFFSSGLVDQTWRFNGQGWSLVCDEGQGQACPHSGALGLDPVRNLVVAVDAQGTWSWDGAAWTLLPVTPSPPVSDRNEMVFDPDRANLVVVDAAGALQPWEFDGTSWKTIAIAASPPARSRMGVAYDEDNHRLMIAGGSLGGNTKGETWILGDAGRPAVLLRFVFASAGRGDGALQSVELRARAGGTGPGGDGVDVLAWNHGRFAALASSTSSLSSPGAVSAVVTGNDLFTLPSGLDESLLFAVAPAHGGDLGVASTVSVDEAEVVVRYRLP
jgi:hypothetical protein